MKKLLAGCLVIIVLAGIALGIAAFLFYRAASPAFENARNYLTRFSELSELEKQITNTTPYGPPDSGHLTEAQVERFARVLDHVRTGLGQRMAEIEEKYKHLESNSDRPPSLTEIVNALGDLAELFVQARRLQVEALNQEGFSQREYRWVRQQMLEAAGVEIASGIDLARLEEAVEQATGVGDVTVPRPSVNVPAENRALVKPYLARMQRWLPLIFFGL
ncbi:MAG: hypothetical protein ACT4QD_03795 [Acidobacteriota bacterium]